MLGQPHSKKSASQYSERTFCLPNCAHPLWYCQWTPLKRSIFIPSLQILIDTDENPLNLIFSRLSRSWTASPCMRTYNHFCSSLLDPPPYIYAPLILRPELSRALQMWPYICGKYPCWSEAGDYLAQVSGRTLYAGEDTISLFSDKGTLQAHIQFGLQQDLQVLLHRAAFQLDSP